MIIIYRTTFAVQSEVLALIQTAGYYSDELDCNDYSTTVLD